MVNGLPCLVKVQIFRRGSDLLRRALPPFSFGKSSIPEKMETCLWKGNMDYEDDDDHHHHHHHHHLQLQLQLPNNLTQKSTLSSHWHQKGQISPIATQHCKDAAAGAQENHTNHYDDDDPLTFVEFCCHSPVGVALFGK